MTLNILQVGDPVLRVIAKPVPTHAFNTTQLRAECDALVRCMREANGAGLAATQVGWDKRICAVEVGQNPRYPYKPSIPLQVMVNPTWSPLSDETFPNFEGCLSVPNLRGIVHRFTAIELQYCTPEGERVVQQFEGLAAGTVQHEVDHLDGKLFLDRVENTKTLTTWDGFEKYHKAPWLEDVAHLVRQKI